MMMMITMMGIMIKMITMNMMMIACLGMVLGLKHNPELAGRHMDPLADLLVDLHLHKYKYNYEIQIHNLSCNKDSCQARSSP